MRIHGDASRPESSDQEESSDDRHRLEEVVLEEISHRAVGRNHPKRVQVNVQHRQPEYQHQRRQFCPGAIMWRTRYIGN